MKNTYSHDHNWIRVRNFLFEASLWVGGIIFLVLGLSLGVYTSDQNTWAREALRYQELVFLSASGKSYGDTEVNHIELTKDLSWSIKVGQYFLSEYKKGILPEKVLSEYRSIREKRENFSKEDSTRNAFSKALAERGVPGPVLSMAQDWRWQKMADSKEEMEVLALILKGERQAPVLKHQSLSFPWKTMLWSWLLLTQLISCLVCMIWASDEDEISLSQSLSFNRLHTYVVLVLLSPGAWPLLAINPAGIRSFNWISARIASVKIGRKKEAHRVAELVPELSYYSDHNLAERLRKRLSKEEA